MAKYTNETDAALNTLVQAWPATRYKRMHSTADSVELNREIILESVQRLMQFKEDFESVTATITAGTTQTQAGGTALTAEINEVSTVANDMDADLIEVHNNAAPFRAHGSEVLIYSDTNEHGRESLSHQLGGNILSSIGQSIGFMVRGIVSSYDRQEKTWTGRKLPILYRTKNTAIITEAGFLTNESDLDKIDVDLDGMNEQIGAAMYLGFIKTFLSVNP